MSRDKRGEGKKEDREEVRREKARKGDTGLREEEEMEASYKYIHTYIHTYTYVLIRSVAEQHHRGDESIQQSDQTNILP